MIRTVRSHLNVEALSHPGMTGKNNEDRYAVASFQVDDHNKMPVLFAVLADGIGGHRGGEVAAELAVNHIMQAVAKSDARHIRRTIEEAVTEASDAVAAHAASNEDLRGMGSTCATAWIVGDQLHTAYVGDSRIYLMRAGRIQQLTIDHTWVQEAMEKGILTPEQARTHPNVHVIRRYLGSAEPPEPDFRLRWFDGEEDGPIENNQGIQLLPNDVLLLCTDGLTDLVWDDEILEIVRSKPTLKEASRALVELANSRGGHDNTTVILVSVPSNFKLSVGKNLAWLPWVIGGVTSAMFILVVGSVLTFGVLRRNTSLTATQTQTSTLSTLFTQTPPIQPTLPSPLPTTIIATQPPLPTAPTYTPWPTNTGIP